MNSLHPNLRAFLAITSFLVGTLLAHAHQDTIIRMEGAQLIGLPEEYSPASLDLESSTFRVGKHQMRFTSFVSNFFEEPHRLWVSASWYHDSSTLPPYIVIHIQPNDKDFSYSLLFSLETLEPIEFSVELKTTESSRWHLPIALEPWWEKEMRESIR